MGWSCLHTGIEICGISLLFSKRDLQRKLALLKAGSPDMMAVRGNDGVQFPQHETAISLGELISHIEVHTTCLPAQYPEVSS
jgi:hypothetical protein